MKLALDAWYELWERTDSGNGVHSTAILRKRVTITHGIKTT